MTTTLVHRESDGDIVPMPQQGSGTISALFQTMARKGITPDDVLAMKELAALYREERAYMAKADFDVAFAQMQRELPTVTAEKIIPSKDGGVKFVHAPFKDIWETVKGVFHKHEFSVDHTMRVQDGYAVVTCTIRRNGHDRSNECWVKIGNAPPGCDVSDSVSVAETKGKRRSFCQALNIHIDDTDVLVDGAIIPASDAARIEARVRALVGDDETTLKRWLALGGVDSFAELRQETAKVVLAQLAKEEAKASVPACPTTGEAWMAGVEARFQEAGKSSSDMGKWLKAQCEKRGASSYLTLTPDQRAELWLLLHKPK
jgi:hypothetical protein